MRLVWIGLAALAAIAPSGVMAQDRAPASAPVVVEFDAAGNPLSRNRPISCSEMRERSAARAAERERAIAAGEQPPPRYFGTCVADSPAPAVTPVAVPAAAPMPSACATQSDILTAGASQRPRYDANGALIRPPAATCAPPPAAVQHTATTNDDRLIVENESSGGCTEDRLLGTRTCRSSGSVTIGNSAEGNERTRRAVDEMLDDLQRD